MASRAGLSERRTGEGLVWREEVELRTGEEDGRGEMR
jgi:hypothetical protein